MFKINCVNNSRLELGEGPHYDSKTNSYYFVDIRGAAIYRYCLSTTNIYQAKLDCKSVSFIIPVEDHENRFVIGYDRKIGLVTWDGLSKTVTDFKFLMEVDVERSVNRLNDGKCDRRGRLWAGTMLDLDDVVANMERIGAGSLYCIDVDVQKTARKCLENVTISNGLAWDRSGKSMFYIDSECRQIWRYDYDPDTATIANKSIVFDFKTHRIPGLPDGMTIDTNDKLWIACFDGSCVIQVDPNDNGRLLQTIPIPARKVTSVAFGGPKYDQLFVTTARLPVPDSNGVCIEHSEQAGCVFIITDLNATGLPAANGNSAFVF